MRFELQNTETGLIVSIPSLSLSLTLIGSTAPDRAIGEHTSISLTLEDSTQLTAFWTEGQPVLTFSTKDVPKSALVIRTNAQSIVCDQLQSVLTLKDQSLLAEVTGGTFTVLNAQDLVLRREKSVCHLLISKREASVEIASTPANGFDGLVASYSNGPAPAEFSIATFDAFDASTATWTRPRPIHAGYPVLSTVPVSGSGMTQSEIMNIHLGLGTESRDVHVRIVARPALRSTDPNPILIVRFPDEFGAFGTPVQIPTKNISGFETYYAKFTVHRQNLTQYYDGPTHLSVYVPTLCETSIPISMQTGLGALDVNSPNPTLF